MAFIKAKSAFLSKFTNVSAVAMLSSTLVATSACDPGETEPAVYEEDGAKVEFIEWRDAEGLVNYDVAVVVDHGAADPTAWILDQGGTPLELYTALMPDEAAPESMYEHHSRIATDHGREDDEVRTFPEWRAHVAIANLHYGCEGWSDFRDYIDNAIPAGAWEERFNLNSNNNPSDYIEDLFPAATGPSGQRQARIRICNYLSMSSGHPRSDRFWVNITRTNTRLDSPVDPDEYWSGWLNNGQRLLYNSNFQAGQTEPWYRATLYNPQVVTAAGFRPSGGANVTAYAAIGYKWL